MTDKLKEAERVAFEAWARPSGFDLRRNEILGHYASLDTTRAWEGWQARAALAQQDVQAVSQVTEQMFAAGQHAWMTADGVDPVRVFFAMLNAAPTPPAVIAKPEGPAT